MEKKCLSKICWGENEKKLKNCFSFHWPPNIRTFHRPPSWGLPSPPSFSFFFKGEFESFGALFSGHNFRFESSENLFLQLSLGVEKWLVFVDGGKRENKLDDCGTFERMKVSRGNVGSLKS